VFNKRSRFAAAALVLSLLLAAQSASARTYTNHHHHIEFPTFGAALFGNVGNTKSSSGRRSARSTPTIPSPISVSRRAMPTAWSSIRNWSDTWNGTEISHEFAVGMAERCGFELRYEFGIGTQYYWPWLFEGTHVY
jgi:hypothetical protein